MKLSFNTTDMNVLISATGSIVKAGTAKEKDKKPHSTEARILSVNRTLLEKLQAAAKVMEKEKRIEYPVDVNRVEAKVLVASLLLTGKLQHQALEEYEKRPEDHKAFSSEPGRTKADYVERLKKRSEEVQQTILKIGRSIK